MLNTLMRSAVVVALLASACSDGGKPVGAACSQNGDCVTNVCQSSIITGGDKTCRCSLDSDCPAGQTCRVTIDTGKKCLLMADAGVQPG